MKKANTNATATATTTKATTSAPPKKLLPQKRPPQKPVQPATNEDDEVPTPTPAKIAATTTTKAPVSTKVATPKKTVTKAPPKAATPEPEPEPEPEAEAETEKPAVSAAAKKTAAAKPADPNAPVEYKLFSELQGVVSPSILQAIEKVFGFDTMTPIQAKTISLCLAGRDVLGKARTGSGKTLAYLLPAVEQLLKHKFTKMMGMGALVISPTRELVLQIMQVVEKLMKFTNLWYLCVMGGNSVNAERRALLAGANLVVGTPGRIGDHLNNCNFEYSHMKCLVLDEADMLLDIGFEVQLRDIIKVLPKDRQTMLFSATLSQRVKSLSMMSLNNPAFVDVEEENTAATPESLQQHFVLCPTESRVDLLITFLCSLTGSSKVIVFFATVAEVIWFHTLVTKFVHQLPVTCLHGHMEQADRTRTFFQYQQAASGILLSTNVTSRGIDIPEVDWIVQYDLPDEPKTYIHRVGRTARAGRSGKAVLFLQPFEVDVCKAIQSMGVPIVELPLPELQSVSAEVTEMVTKQRNYQYMVGDAVRAWSRWYQQVCTAFHFVSPSRDAVVMSFGVNDESLVPMVSHKGGAPSGGRSMGGHGGGSRFGGSGGFGGRGGGGFQKRKW